MMAKRRARWKRTDRWRLKTAFDIPALLISLTLGHTQGFPEVQNSYELNNIWEIEKHSRVLQLFPPNSITALPPRGSLLLSKKGRVGEVKEHLLLLRSILCHFQRPNPSLTPLGLESKLSCELSWLSPHLPRLLTCSYHGPPDASQEKTGGCNCAPSQHHILISWRTLDLLRFYATGFLSCVQNWTLISVTLWSNQLILLHPHLLHNLQAGDENKVVLLWIFLKPLIDFI